MAEPKTEEFLDEIEKAEIEELGDELIDIDEEAAELDEIECRLKSCRINADLLIAKPPSVVNNISQSPQSKSYLQCLSSQPKHSCISLSFSSSNSDLSLL